MPPQIAVRSFQEASHSTESEPAQKKLRVDPDVNYDGNEDFDYFCPNDDEDDHRDHDHDNDIRNNTANSNDDGDSLNTENNSNDSDSNDKDNSDRSESGTKFGYPKDNKDKESSLDAENSDMFHPLTKAALNDESLRCFRILQTNDIEHLGVRCPVCLKELKLKCNLDFGRFFDINYFEELQDKTGKPASTVLKDVKRMIKNHVQEDHPNVPLWNIYSKQIDETKRQQKRDCVTAGNQPLQGNGARRTWQGLVEWCLRQELDKYPFTNISNWIKLDNSTRLQAIKDLFLSA